MNAASTDKADDGRDRRRKPKIRFGALRRHNYATTFSVGLVLVLGAAWYYLYANTASQTLAERDFRQLNQLSEHANGVLSNFPYLFQFSLLQEADLDLLEASRRDGHCAADQSKNRQAGLFEFLRCEYQRLEELKPSSSRVGTSTAASQDPADIAQAVRDRELQRLERYFQGIHHNKVLSNLSLNVLPIDPAECSTDDTATAANSGNVAFRLEGPPGRQIIAIFDCRASGAGAADIRKRLVARLPFADLFSPSSVNLDFDQIGVIDSENNVMFLSTERINRRNQRVGQMIDTSAFARIAKLDFEQTTLAGGELVSTEQNQHSTTILERKLGNISYKIFVQPHVPSLSPLGDVDSARWSIIGLKQTERFNVERFPLPAYQFGLFTFALILSVSLLPTIRLLFLGQGTSLSRLDFSILVFSLIIATGAAVVMGLMVDTHLKMSNDQRLKLEQTSSAINQRLMNELRQKYIALAEVESRITQGYVPPENVLSRLLKPHLRQNNAANPGLVERILESLPRIDELTERRSLDRDVIKALSILASPRLLYERVGKLIEAEPKLVEKLPAAMRLHDQAHRERAPLNDIPLENYDPSCWNATQQLQAAAGNDGTARKPINFDLAWVMDGSGKQIGSQVSARRSPVRFISVPNREYFLRAQAGRVWHPPWLGDEHKSTGLFVERVFSRISGNRLTIIAKPSFASASHKDSSALREAGCAPQVAAIATHLDSLVNPVLPAGFGYAVINDTDGTVLYHSDDNLSLIQNFYTETTNNKSLLAATQFDEADHFTASYSGRQVQAYVAPIAAVPWSLIVFQDRELNASMALSSAFFAFGLVVVIAMVVFIAMEALHWRGYLISKGWWPHRDHTHLHAIVLIVSAAYLIGLVTSLNHPNLRTYVLASLVLGPYLFACLSLMWNRSSPLQVLALSLPPILFLWWMNLSLLGIVVLFAVFCALVYLALKHIKRRSVLAGNFRIIHAFAGVVFLSAMIGAPAILFYADALSFHLMQEQSIKDASFDNDFRRRRIAHNRYAGSLRTPSDHLLTEPCVGVYTQPSTSDDHIRACSKRGEMVLIDPHGLFAPQIAGLLASWFNPIAAETAMLRPRSSTRSANNTAMPSTPVSRYVSNKIVALILLVLTIFLYVIARVASRRLFGLQGDASHYLEHWPREGMQANASPAIESLRHPALLIGYSPSSVEIENWGDRYIVSPIELATDIEANGRTVILYGLETVLAETDAERSENYRGVLERLEVAAKHLVLCSDALPSYWLSHAVDDERAAISGGIVGRKKWLHVLGGFTWYAPPRGSDNAAHTNAAKVHANYGYASDDPRSVLVQELGAFPELSSLFDRLEDRVRKLSTRQVLPVVFHAAHAIYARKWHACTLTEQALLLQIARKEIVNPEQYEVIGSLEVRGLLRRDPRIRMANQTFLWFVENASISEELADHSAEYQSNLWQTMRWPVLIVLALFALFLFQLGGEKIEFAIGGLGSLLALATVGRNLLAQIKGGTKT